MSAEQLKKTLLRETLGPFALILFSGIMVIKTTRISSAKLINQGKTAY